MITIDNSYINDNNVSALDYSSNVGIGFTFNPTLSISLSSSDLIIDNLKPGTAEDSNSINVSVATNAAYGYNLSATVGSNTYNNTSLNNINSSDNNDNNNNNDSSNYTFNSIATNADLPSLTTNNTWGYSYKLSNDSSWSNYSGLPLFSDSNNKTLVDKYTESEDTINFKIAAKASNTQPSGTYSNVINFNAVSYAVPMSLADSYAYFGAELYHGYYKMQDMTTRICQTTEAPSELQVIDVRDDKVYWIAKLADGNCWMTQNLDLDLTSNPEADNYIALTSEDTDLNDTTSAAYQDGYTVSENGVITWVPASTATTYNHTIGSNNEVSGWVDDANIPYSAEGGDIYYFTNNLDEQYTPDIKFNSKDSCIDADHTAEECSHYHVGNYYNSTAAIASNQSWQFIARYAVAGNSICPAGWRLPKGAAAADFIPEAHEFNQLFYIYGITTGLDSRQYATNGFINIRRAPLYFVRSGYIYGGNSLASGTVAHYNSSTAFNNVYFYAMNFERRWVVTSNYSRNFGSSVRCLAR